MGSIGWLEWLGYAASVVIVLSLMMSSIIRLRLVNLAGAALMAAYGFLIGSIPVGALNAAIVAINVFHLARMGLKRDFFQVLAVAPEGEYLNHFIGFYRQEIARLFPDFDPAAEGRAAAFFVLRNTVPAGLFLATREGDDTLRVDVDFVTREYRDFRIGRFIFEENEQALAATGCSRLVAHARSGAHARYLTKMGFTRAADNTAGAALYERALS
jgi:GNAT superfamily N-acetyltransferase